jgi:DNA-binding LacI/PurR family transcriptional regulator
MAEMYSISRGTLRQAMSLLVNEGLVERTPGKGTFIRRRETAKSTGKFIGLVVPYARDFLIMDILLGVESAAKARGYSSVFLYTNEDMEQETQDIRRMQEEDVAGLVIFPISNILYDPNVWRLHEETFPFVLIDRYFPDLETDYVIADGIGGAYRATEHLINLGYTDITFVSSAATQTTSVRQRYQGYRRALANYGLADRGSWLRVPVSDLSDDDIYLQHIGALLRSPDRPEAIFTVNDLTAFHVLAAARAEGLSVPEDLGVVGFDDIEMAARFSVPLTTVAQPRYEIGVRAAHLVIDKAEGIQSGLEQIVLPTTLVVRQSCGARDRSLLAI